MEILDSAVGFLVNDHLLDFNLEAGEEETCSASSMESSHRGGPFPESVEEDLEWLSNKDAFPGVETCFGILADNPELILNQQSPVSVLENSSGNGSSVASYCSGLKVPGSFPVRPRSKRQRRKRSCCSAQLSSQQYLWQNQVIIIKQEALNLSSPPLRSMGRRCFHCQADKTPQWRAGPMGLKTLCNACGVRYKSGRLLPEYRPANSPTFSSVLHSSSHRKVVEMRRKKACGYMD